MSNFLGPNIGVPDTSAKFTLGAKYRNNGTGKTYMYCKFAGTTAANDIGAITTGFVFTVLTGAGNADGVSPIAAAANEYGWVQVGGLVSAAKADAGVAANEYIGVVTNGAGKFLDVAATEPQRGRAFTTASATLADIYLFDR